MPRTSSRQAPSPWTRASYTTTSTAGQRWRSARRKSWIAAPCVLVTSPIRAGRNGSGCL